MEHEEDQDLMVPEETQFTSKPLPEKIEITDDEVVTQMYLQAKSGMVDPKTLGDWHKILYNSSDSGIKKQAAGRAFVAERFATILGENIGMAFQAIGSMAGMKEEKIEKLKVLAKTAADKEEESIPE